MSGIAVLGSANMDLVVRQPRWVRPGETMFGSHFVTGAGGKGLNQAVAAARAGARVSFIGAVGEDEFGERLRVRLMQEGIDTRRLVIGDAPTGIASIAVVDTGENAIVVVPGANASRSLSEGDRAVVASASHLVVQLERPAALVREALAFAREHRVTTVLTPAPVQPAAAELSELADILVANHGEASAIAHEPDAERAALDLSRQGRTVVVTLGARGAVMARDGALVHRVAARPVTAIDTTGAGDAFVGALVAWLADGADWEEALGAATAAGALAVTRHGAADAAPKRADIAALLASDAG